MALKGQTPWNKGIFKNRVCSVDNCGKKHYGNGYCSMHNARLIRNGSSDRSKERNPGQFKAGEDHPNWRGEAVGNKGLHQWVEDFLGRPKKCEDCGTTTAKRFDWANISREYKRSNGLKDWKRLCRKCHIAFDNAQARGEKNGQSKLTDKDVIKIRNLYVLKKYHSNKLAKEFGVSGSVILAAIKRRTWKHVNAMFLGLFLLLISSCETVQAQDENNIAYGGKCISGEYSVVVIDGLNVREECDYQYIDEIVKCILGEARGEGYDGMVAIAEAIRNRGTLRGVYGCRAVFNEPKWVWDLGRKAWEESEHTQIVKGADHWGSTKVDGKWIARMEKTMTFKAQVKNHKFFKQ